jgi:hypothetical protein
MKNRNMFYQNIQEGYNNPGMFIPPQGYNMNTQYQSYGPNVIPQENSNNEYEERINRLEKQVRNLDSRLQKIEMSKEDTSNDNFYMI